MLRYLSGRAEKVGAPPGSLVHIGAEAARATTVTVTYCAPDSFEERVIERPQDCALLADHEGITWIAVNGLEDTAMIEALGERYHLHPLVLEDVLDTGHLPKVEEYDGYIYLVARAFTVGESEPISEQVSLILLPGVVISVEEGRGAEVFAAVRERLRAGRGRIRGLGADYLFYALLDIIVDGYFVALESLGERIGELEDAVVEQPTPELLRSIHKVKRELFEVRRATWPMRDVVSWLERTAGGLVSVSTEPFLRDVYDHTVQVAETAETFREILLAMQDTYLSSVSNRMNEIMKVLTIIATIFIPLTFIAGIYGMNFKYMPELEHPWGYPATLALMAGVALTMVLYFRRRHWL